jgi:voltage-gated potassium channel
MDVIAPPPADPTLGAARLERIADRLEWPIAILALLVVPALVLEEHGGDARLREAAYFTNWVVWLAFCGEFGIRWAARPRLRFLREAWFDLLLIVVSPPFLVPDALQGARGLRAVRMLRLLRLVRAGAVAAIGLRLGRHLFGRRKFHYTAVVAVAVVLMGALGMFAVERGQNHSVSSFGDALWWSVVTATTVGYGDLSPVTTEGRFIAVLLMLTGIGVIGVFTATVASMFFEDDREDSAPDVHERLDHLERKLDAVLDRLEVSARSTDGVVKR